MTWLHNASHSVMNRSECKHDICLRSAVNPCEGMSAAGQKMEMNITLCAYTMSPLWDNVTALFGNGRKMMTEM